MVRKDTPLKGFQEGSFPFRRYFSLIRQCPDRVPRRLRIVYQTVVQVVNSRVFPAADGSLNFSPHHSMYYFH